MTNNRNSEKLTPFIKWAGGKRKLLNQINELIPAQFHTYFEPFLGGGAVLLDIQPTRAVINDLNFELINAWQMVKQHPNELREFLAEAEKKNSKEFYLDLRAADRDGRIDDFSLVQRAARFIYMNKTGFNGLWRVNSKGQNNVPYGRYKNPKINIPMIDQVSNYLRTADVQLHNEDYLDVLAMVARGDFVYIDSPYDVVSDTSSFTAYTKDGFSREDQIELRNAIINLTNKGAKVLASNADTQFINEIYAHDSRLEIHHIQAARFINSNASRRGPVGEVLITNY